MTYEQILYTVADEIATLTLNRPEKLNAWTLRMGAEFDHALRAASADPAVRVVVITGAGRAFCSGADLSLLSSASAAGGAVATRPGESTESLTAAFTTSLAACQKPVLAAIHGPAMGMGFALALCCDIRFASTEARFSTVFSKLGLIAEYNTAWLLPRLVGISKAFGILYTSRILDAAEALHIGLVEATYPAESFTVEVHKHAKLLAETVSPRSLSVMRRQVYAALSETFEQSARSAEHEMYQSLKSEDFREGVSAFMSKRPPAFEGK
jgi:enoyl-CoA hydratase/carnithine racemase